MANTTKASGGRSRSFGGCVTCRNRHMKCDETRPSCLICSQAGFTCGGYEKNIFFNLGDSSSDGATRFRRPVLTEKERQSMSGWLTTTVPPRLAMHTLALIDEQCEESPETEEIQISRGPFGAFRVVAPQPIQADTSFADECGAAESEQDFTILVDSLPTPPELEFENEEYPVPPDLAVTPRTQNLFDTYLDSSTSALSSMMMDPWGLALGSDRIEELLDDAELDTSTSLAEFLPQTTTAPIQLDSSFDCQIPTLPHEGALSYGFGNTVPQDAVFLLKYYSTTFLKLLTPLCHSKTPWHVLFVPHSKGCLAALTLGEDIDSASLCAFQGTLAISAFSLGRTSQSSMWIEQAKSYKSQARESARLMLAKAYDVPKAAKYKSILIALLTMVQLAMMSGDSEQIDCYLLETEKFIRLKGLNRKKSRKVRLLHHCYVFERMFHESIFVSGINGAHRRHVYKTIQSSAAARYSLDSISFYSETWINLDEGMRRIKGKVEGENDLHLEFPGVWNSTLYPEIFGTSEIYMTMLSMTIRLGQQKDMGEKEGSLSLKEFLRRAKSLETCIHQLKTLNHTKNQSTTNQPNMEEILQAMQHALLIYFYRRIYDMDGALLQQSVVSVHDCLMRFGTLDSEVAFGSARLIWPAFIAACEAEDPSVQRSFLQWFEDSATSSGMRSFEHMKSRLEWIWQQKATANGTSVSWLELMQGEVQIIHAD
ncbi:hypothetical protein BU24DRAFT_418802 [Aaosphaeria arxii CBS 175.79]|uniref:Zn(2)-C6 fungal-type domain-containing protein n=1 Tax=Aaosphaeria arxii CBS 175.79 TaxID=1450172 RepID=A0A6A5Y155_9PLEO|nr:uncharacterized protein BU24DRAFT_418802 [Aaosphaeria arxii CBS 175.79]KAF2019202.1 hypothetical protein BU24DRAFT_418802 [Aaosphaeria arxii CBS 175.79]